MNVLNIFIASSCELSEQRVQIGDYIRKLSYDYSPRGLRLHLACWEDFYPEYTGISKQQEYDEELIKTCDIFIAMFRTRCGIYTQHEVQLAINLGKECHILQLPSTEDCNELEQFLSSIEIASHQCDDSLLLANIESIIADYLKVHKISLSSEAIPPNTWRLYATIPNDLEELKIPFSNMVRKLESLLEEPLGCYFTLHPYHTPANIASTDHYLCFIKDYWNQEDEQEVKIAYDSCKSVNFPQTTLLYQQEGHSGEESNLLAIKINSELQGFSKPFSHIDTIQSDLMNWALRHKIGFVLNNVQTFSIDGDIIKCYDRPFFYLPMYPDLHKSVKYITASITKIDEKIRRNIKEGKVKDEALAIELAQKRKNKEEQLQTSINSWYNKIQLLENSYVYNTEKSPLEAVKAKQYEQYKEWSNQIRIQILQNEEGNPRSLENLATNLLEWEKAADNCLFVDTIHVSEYIQVLRFIVQVCDTYLHPLKIEFDEDDIFKKIVNAADKYNYHTLFTEIMRVNYANSFNRDLEYKDAGKYYLDAYKHILDIDDNSVQAHRYKSYIIHSLLHHLIDIDDKESVLKFGQQYESLIYQWQRINIHTSYDVDLARCYSAILAAAPKYYGVCKDLAEKSELLIEKLHRKYDNRPFDDDYFDAICYFNIVLSTYYIDRYEKGDDEYFNKALYYIKESQKSLQARYPYDPEYIQFSLSEPLHNRGFLYSKADDWEKAISNYKSALKKREALYEKNLSDSFLFEIAETLVNLGDAYRMTKKLDKALECAQKAVSIYGSKRSKEISVFDMHYYKAYQLEATILMDIDKEKGVHPHEALKMMQECMDWSKAHPNNDYEDRFEGVSGIILNSYKL